MNTKNKIIAILMASIVAMAVGVPMAMSATPPTEATVNDVPSTYSCSATVTEQPDPVNNTAGNVNFELVVTDNNGDDTIPDGTWTAVWDTNTVQLTADSVDGTLIRTCTDSQNDNIPANQPAGIYLVSFKLNGSEVCNTTFTVTETIAYSIDFNKVDYGDSLNPGATSEVLGNTTMETTGAAPPVKPTIKNDANVVMGVEMSIADVTGPEALFPSNTEARVNSSLPGDYETLTGATTPFNEAIAIGATANIDTKLSVPSGTKAGSYTGTLTVTGVKSV